MQKRVSERACGTSTHVWASAVEVAVRAVAGDHPLEDADPRKVAVHGELLVDRAGAVDDRASDDAELRGLVLPRARGRELADERLLDLQERREAELELEVLRGERWVQLAGRDGGQGGRVEEVGRVRAGGGALEGLRVLDFGHGLEDDADGADEVELDDGSPEDTFFAEGRGGVYSLEFCVNGRTGRWIEKMLENFWYEQNEDSGG